ncbi:MAG: tetratricopeptide repeat protein [Myxococcota bacterium]
MGQEREEKVVDVEVEPSEGRLTPSDPTEGEDRIAEPSPSEVAPEGPVTVGDLVEGAKMAVDTVGTTARRWVDQGRYRKVRISRKGKQVLPDIPVAAVAAVEAASLYTAGFARVLAANVGARFLFDIEVVNEADKYFETGVERFLEGDLERAESALLKAVRIDDTHAGAYLQLGVLYRMRGESDKARPVLERARGLDDAGEIGRKAGDILRALDG